MIACRASRLDGTGGGDASAAKPTSDGSGRRPQHRAQANAKHFLLAIVLAVKFARFKHIGSSFAHAANNQVGKQVDDEGDYKQEDTDRKQGLVVGRSSCGFSQLGSDGCG